MANKREKSHDLRSSHNSGDFYSNSGHTVLPFENDQDSELADEQERRRKVTEAIFGLGDVYGIENQFEKAVDYHEEALKIAKEQKDKQQEGMAYVRLGRAYKVRNQFQVANEYFEKALTIAEQERDSQLETKAVLALGDSYLMNNQLKVAIQYFEKALKITKEQDTTVYLMLGVAYWLDGEFHQAIEHHEKALEIAREQGHKQLEISAHVSLGEVYGMNKQLQNAVEHLEKALDVAKANGDEEKETEVLVRLGSTYRLNNQFQEAVTSLEKGLEIAKNSGNRMRQREAYTELGHAYKLNDQFEEAIEYFGKALDIARELGYGWHESETYLELGHIYMLNKQIKKAILYYGKILKIAKERDNKQQDQGLDFTKEGGDKRQQTQAYLGIGRAYFTSTQFELAVESFQKASKIATERKDGESESNAYLELGNVYTKNDQFPSAIQYYEQALQVAKQEKLLNETNIHIEMGIAYQSNKQAKRAIESFMQGLESVMKQGNKTTEIDLYFWLAKSHLSNDEIEKAIEFYEKALNLLKEQGVEDKVAVVYLLICDLNRSKNQFKAAEEYFEKALKIPNNPENETHAWALLGLGQCRYSSMQYGPAIEYFGKALEIAKQQGDKSEEITKRALLGLGHSYRLNKQFEPAIEYFGQVLKISKEQGNKQQEGQVLLGLADSYRSKGQFETAIGYYDQALKLAKQQERKHEEAAACVGLANSYKSNNEIVKVIEYLEKALKISEELGDKQNVGNYSFDLGIIHVFENRFKAAKYYFNKSLEIAREQQNTQRETHALLELGRTCRLNNEIQSAYEYYNKALKIAKEQGYQKEEARALGGLGDTYTSHIQDQTKVEHVSNVAEEIAVNLAKNIAKTTIRNGSRNTDAFDDNYGATANVSASAEWQDTQHEAGGNHDHSDINNKGFINDTIGTASKEQLLLGHSFAEGGNNENGMKIHSEVRAPILDETAKYSKEKGYHQEKVLPLNGLENTQKLHIQDDTENEPIKTVLNIAKEMEEIFGENFAKNVLTNTDAAYDNYSAAENVPDCAQLHYTKQETGGKVDRSDISDKSFIGGVDRKNAAPFVDAKQRKDSKTKSYQQLGNVAARNGKYKKAIEYYQKAHRISPDLQADEIEVTAYQWLGYNQLLAGEYQEAIQHYRDVVKLAPQLGHKKRKLNAYLGLGSAFSNIGDFASARKYYIKAQTTAELFNDKHIEGEVHTNLGHVYYKSSSFNYALKSYFKAQEFFHDLGESEEETNICVMLGHTFRQLKQYEKAIEFYDKALGINKELMGQAFQRNRYEKSLEGIINEWCGYCCRFISGKDEEAITFYEKAKAIAKQDGKKYQEYRTNQAIGNILWNTGNFENSKGYYQEALENSMELRDKHCEGTSHLNLASVCSMESDYDTAREWYERALNIFETDQIDQNLKQNALTGLGIAWLNLGNTQKATELIERARKFVEEETGKDNVAVNLTVLTDQNRSPIENLPWSQTPEEKMSLEDFPTYQESQPVTVEFANLVVVEAFKPDRAETFSDEYFAALKKHTVEFSASYVYTHPMSSKEPLTASVRKSMTTNVKSSAYKNLLGSGNNKTFGKTDEKFVNEDHKVFNFAKKDIYKNTATKMPAILNKYFAKYINSVGLITCGDIRGTCFLVREDIVITNHHVCTLKGTHKERKEQQNPNLPITVSFNFHFPAGTEHDLPVVTVDVDEKWKPDIDNSNLDYKFLHLKNKQDPRDHPPLGPMVRCRPIREGRVVIMGHSEGKEMHQETCVVVRTCSWREKLEQRNEIAGVHMTNAQKLESAEKYKDCLPYDTSLFSGASGSPVFDMNGHIVALHTQGYTLDVEGGKRSLMEFGVQFNAICEHMKSKDDTNLNLLKEFFPNYKLCDEVFKEEPADDRYSQEPSDDRHSQESSDDRYSQEPSDDRYSQESSQRRYNQESMDNINSNQTTDEINDDQVEPMDED